MDEYGLSEQKEKSLEDTVASALKQIEEKQYEAELKNPVFFCL